MSLNSKLLLEGIYASHKVKDNTIVLSSSTLDDFSVTLDKKSTADKLIRNLLMEKGKINSGLTQIIESFHQQGVTNTEYNSGMFILRIRDNDRLSQLKLPEHYVSLYERKNKNETILVGLNCHGVPVLGLAGAGGSGKSTFIKEKFTDANSMIVNFSKIDYRSISPIRRENYGDDIAQEFLKDSSKKFLILDHIPSGHKEKRFVSHPALYSDTVRQICEYINFFGKAGKTLVLSGVNHEGIISGHQSDAVLEFLGMNSYINYGFSFKGIDFPPITLIES